MEGGSWTCTNFILKEKGRYWKIFHTPFLCIWTCLSYLWWTSLVAQMVKHLPTMRETQVQSLGQEDPLKKEMATHSSILAWKIPWTEEAGRLQFMGSHRVGHDWSNSAAAAAAVKAMVFSVVMYGCDSWTIKTAECQRIDVFELWCWRRQIGRASCRERV